MNIQVALLGIIEIVSAITIGVFILALTYKIVHWVGERFYGIDTFHNLAYSIFTASIMVSVGIMVSGVIPPLISSFRLMEKSDQLLLVGLKYFGVGAIYIAIAYTAAVLIGLLSTFLYSKLTPINEFEEIKQNNVGVALIIAAIALTLTMLTKSGVGLLIESIVPYPELPGRF